MPEEQAPDRPGRLADRRAEQAGHPRSEVETLRDELTNLTDETHALRGTLTAYAKWTDLTPEIERRMRQVEATVAERVKERAAAVEQERVLLAAKRRRRRVWWAGGLALLVASFFARVTVDNARDAATFERAFLADCHERQMLEVTLRDVLTSADSNPATPPERLAQLEEFAARLTSPACADQLDTVTS